MSDKQTFRDFDTPTNWDETLADYNSLRGDEVRCIHCDRRIAYNNTLKRWSHWGTALTTCEPVTVATPPLNYRP